jgi:hypothetical protein
VKASQARMQRAQREIEEMSRQMQAKDATRHGARNSHDQKRRRGAPKGEKTAMITAMATTLAAEQQEIDELRNKLGRMSAQSSHHDEEPSIIGAGAQSSANSTVCATACKGLFSASLARCMVDCNSLTALSAFERGSLRHSLPATKQGSAQGRGQGRHGDSPSPGLGSRHHSTSKQQPKSSHKTLYDKAKVASSRRPSEDSREAEDERLASKE